MAANNLPNAVDDLFTLAERNGDGLATLTGLPSGATVPVQVTALSDTGESHPSVVRVAVVP